MKSNQELNLQSFEKNFSAILREHQQAFEASFTPASVRKLHEIASALIDVLRAGGKILLCGNGGSAADAQHIAAEFVVRFKRTRRSLPAIALTTDTSILTAAANDFSFEQIFARQVEGLGRKGDLLIALSTSGNSRNVLEAVRQAKNQGLLTVGFTGGKGGALKGFADLCFNSETDRTSHIQEIHIIALHAIADLAEEICVASQS